MATPTIARSDTDTLTITYTAGNGTLADGSDFTGGTLSGAAGAYTLSGTAAAISSELDALVFKPVDGVPNTAVTTTFTLRRHQRRLYRAAWRYHRQRDHGHRQRSGGGADDRGDGWRPDDDFGSTGDAVLQHYYWRRQ